MLYNENIVAITW